MSEAFVWFHNDSAEPTRTREFYDQLLGWKPSEGPGGMTMFAGARGPFASLDAGRDARTGWVPYVEVDDVDAATKRALGLGATLVAAKRRGPAGDVEGVLGDTGDAVVGDGAAERVEEGVVGEFAVIGDDGPAFDVDRFDARQTQPYPGAGEHVGQRAPLEILAGRELVEAYPLDEVGLGVDDGDLRVGGVEAAGQAPGREGPGVAGAEDDDAVLHDPAPVSSLVD